MEVSLAWLASNPWSWICPSAPASRSAGGYTGLTGGQGYATEAAGAWLDYGFDLLGLAEIVAFTDSDNHRSLAVMRRLGMVRDPSRDFDFPEFPEGDPRRAALMHCVISATWHPKAQAK